MQNLFNEVEKQLDEFGNNVGQLKGKVSLLTEQQNASSLLIQDCTKNEMLYTQAVELLSIIQKVTRDKITQSFEQIVTHALNYIFESDKYSFHLVFGKRGNLQELNFAVQTPDKNEPLDPLTTDAGGILNVISFALRVVLMEVSNPKVDGFILSDENFANLSADHIERASEFLKEVNTKFSRQIIAISHQTQMLDNADKLIKVE